LPVFRAFGVLFEGWADADAGALADGLERMRRGVEGLREQNASIFDGLVKIALAEAEARAGDVDRALAILGEALATCDRIGHRSFESELNRVRGEILFERDPGDTTSAEEAFQTAISIAKQQGARSFGLRAALSLAKLYQSTGRPADAHAVLAPAVEGFAATQEMPELAEAQALLAALSQTDEVKARAVKRDQRLRLQVAYGAALVSTRGYGAPETTAALDRARELAPGGSDPVARFSALYGEWISALFTKTASDALEVARMALAATRGAEDSLLGGVAHRMMGVSLGYCGDFGAGKAHLNKALAILDGKRDTDLSTRFNDDPLIGARIRSAFVAWSCGEPGSRRLTPRRRSSRRRPSDTPRRSATSMAGRRRWRRCGAMPGAPLSTRRLRSPSPRRPECATGSRLRALCGTGRCARAAGPASAPRSSASGSPRCAKSATTRSTISFSRAWRPRRRPRPAGSTTR
jgi:tetratricopeptide (TPR) repeat protein